MRDSHATQPYRRTIIVPRRDGSQLLVDDDPDDRDLLHLATRYSPDADASVITVTRRELQALALLTGDPHDR